MIALDQWELLPIWELPLPAGYTDPGRFGWCGAEGAGEVLEFVRCRGTGSCGNTLGSVLLISSGRRPREIEAEELSSLYAAGAWGAAINLLGVCFACPW